MPSYRCSDVTAFLNEEEQTANLNEKRVPLLHECFSACRVLVFLLVLILQEALLFNVVVNSSSCSYLRGCLNALHQVPLHCHRTASVTQDPFFIWQLSFVTSCRWSAAQLGRRLSGLH